MLSVKKDSSSKKARTIERKKESTSEKTYNSSRVVTGASKTVVTETRKSTGKSYDGRMSSKDTKVSIGSDRSIVPTATYQTDRQTKRKSDSSNFITTSGTLKKMDSTNKIQTLLSTVSSEGYLNDGSLNAPKDDYFKTLISGSNDETMENTSTSLIRHEEENHETVTISNFESNSRVQEIQSVSSNVVSESIQGSPKESKKIVATLYEPCGDESMTLTERSVNTVQSSSTKKAANTSSSSLEVSSFEKENFESTSTSQVYRSSSYTVDESAKFSSSVDDDISFSHSSMTSRDSVMKSESFDSYVQSKSDAFIDSSSVSNAEVIIEGNDVLNDSRNSTLAKSQNSKTQVDLKKIYKGPAKEQCICEICTCG